MIRDVECPIVLGGFRTFAAASMPTWGSVLRELRAFQCAVIGLRDAAATGGWGRAKRAPSGRRRRCGGICAAQTTAPGQSTQRPKNSDPAGNPGGSLPSPATRVRPLISRRPCCGCCVL